jgi:hypothetical protein
MICTAYLRDSSARNDSRMLGHHPQHFSIKLSPGHLPFHPTALSASSTRKRSIISVPDPTSRQQRSLLLPYFRGALPPPVDTRESGTSSANQLRRLIETSAGSAHQRSRQYSRLLITEGDARSSFTEHSLLAWILSKALNSSTKRLSPKLGQNLVVL